MNHLLHDMEMSGHLKHLAMDRLLELDSSCPINGNKSLIELTLESFIQTGPRLLSEIEADAQAGIRARLHDSAQLLHSTSSNIGAVMLAEFCADLAILTDSRSAAGNVETELIALKVSDQFQKTFLEVLNVLAMIRRKAA